MAASRMLQALTQHNMLLNPLVGPFVGQPAVAIEAFKDPERQRRRERAAQVAAAGGPQQYGSLEIHGATGANAEGCGRAHAVTVQPLASTAYGLHGGRWQVTCYDFFTFCSSRRALH